MANLAHPDYMDIGVTVITSSFQIRGKLHILGMIGTFLNDEQKPTVVVYGAEMLGLEANSRIRVNKDEVVISKRAALVIAFDELPPQGTLAMLPRMENLAVYLDHMALSANFYMGQDARINDFADTSLQQFLIASDIKFYPMFQARAGLVQSAPMGVLHKTAIRMYHRP